MSDAAEKAVLDAQAAVKAWNEFCSRQEEPNVRSEVMRLGVSELMKIRGEMRAIRILLSEGGKPTGCDNGNA